MTAPLAPEAIIALAREAGGEGDAPFVELYPSGTVRTFRVADMVVRFDESEGGDGLPAATRAMRTLRRAVQPPIVPELLGEGRAMLGGEERPWLAYRWLDGPTLTAAQARARPHDLGRLLANLHGARVFDLLFRFERQRPMTLMDSFKTLSEQLRAWLLARETDGLSQDLLTLTLSDLQRAMRQYAVAQDHHFRTARRRVLLHGRPRPSAIVSLDAGQDLYWVNLEESCLGDGAEDAARLALAVGFSDEEETDFLSAYLQRLEELGRPDPRFLLRFFPRRFLLQLTGPVGSLHRMLRLKQGTEPSVADPVTTLEDMMERTYESLTEAFNGLRGFVGGMRPVTVREVKGMGRLLAYEELLLRDRFFRLVISGLPYAGKTEVGSAIARRLQHAYLNTSVLARAVAAWPALSDEDKSLPVEKRPARLFQAGFRIDPISVPPYYRAHLGKRDVTDSLRSDEVSMAGAQVLDVESVRTALRDEIRHHYAAGGVVIEGAYAAQLAPGRARVFHLISDHAVRRARLMNHRHDITDEDAADELLARLDEGAGSPPEGATVVDVGGRPAGPAALDILWHLLPESRRPSPAPQDLTGRPPL